MASKTAGGLEKITIAFEPDEVAWLKAEKAGPGRPPYAVSVRQAVRAKMAAEQRPMTTEPTQGRGGAAV